MNTHDTRTVGQYLVTLFNVQLDEEKFNWQSDYDTNYRAKVFNIETVIAGRDVSGQLIFDYTLVKGRLKLSIT